MLHIKLKGMERACTCMEHNASTYSVLTHTHSLSGTESKGQKIVSGIGHVAYQIRVEWSIEHHANT